MGTGINSDPGFAEAAAAEIARLADLPFVTAHYAMDNDLTLKAAALKLGFVDEAEFDRVVDPAKMVRPYVAAAAGSAAQTGMSR